MEKNQTEEREKIIERLIKKKEDSFAANVVGLFSVACLCAFSYLGGTFKGKDIETEYFVKTPIVMEQRDMNNDGLEDRVFTIGGDKKQTQYQFVVDNSIKYLTEDQIQRYKAKPVEMEPVKVRNSVDNLDYKINTGGYTVKRN